MSRKGGESALWVRDLDRETPRKLEGTEGADNYTPAAGMFWSPDSKNLAYFSPVVTTTGGGADGEESEDSQSQIVLQKLGVLDVGNGEISDIATFLPTDEFLTRLPYFDQYHHSVTIWSPDSDSLVLSVVTPDEGPAIWIAAASGNLTPRFITPGRLAYWSWQ